MLKLTISGLWLRIVPIVSLVLVVSWCQARPPEIVFERFIDGPYSVASLARGRDSYILTGIAYAHSPPTIDVLILKLDREGRVVWRQVVDGGAGGPDEGTMARETRDGGTVVVGRGVERSGDSLVGGAYVMRTDSDGVILWDRLYRGGLSPQDVLEKPDGFVILGFKDVDDGILRRQAVLLAIDSEGNVQWEQHHGGPGMEYGMAMLETEDGYLICGQTSSFPSPNMSERGYLLHVDRRGGLLWERALPEPTHFARRVERSPDGGFLIAGSTVVPKNGRFEGGAFLVNTTASGEHVRSTFVGGPRAGAYYDLTVTPDGGVIFASAIQGSENFETYLVKVSPSGSIQWEFVFPGTNGARGIVPALDGGYMIAGMARPGPNNPREESLIHILKFSEESPEEVFLRGDPTGDSIIELRDAVRVLKYLFCRETAPWCLDSADANDDGVINLTDAISIIQAVLSSEAALPPPSDEPGSDPTPDSLDCQ